MIISFVIVETRKRPTKSDKGDEDGKESKDVSGHLRFSYLQLNRLRCMIVKSFSEFR